MYGNVPSYESLKIIGCLCYAANTKLPKDKFGPKGVKCVFLGYPPGQKGYKLYNLGTKEVFYSRDVIFEEHIFPFKVALPENSSHNNLPSVLFHTEDDSDVPTTIPDSNPNTIPVDETTTPSESLTTSPNVEIPTPDNTSVPHTVPQPNVPLRRSSRTTNTPN